MHHNISLQINFKKCRRGFSFNTNKSLNTKNSWNCNFWKALSFWENRKDLKIDFNAKFLNRVP